MLTHPELLRARFEALTTHLLQTRSIWPPKPFSLHRLPWEDDHRALATWLRDLPLERTLAMEVDPRAPDAPEPWGRWLEVRAPLVALGPMGTAAPDAIPSNHRIRYQIPGRKWAQVSAFGRALLPALEQSPQAAGLLDWCAGHGHLGRTLGRVTGLPVRLLERHGAMEATALKMARRLGTEVEFIQGDALDPRSAKLVNAHTVAVGLHACGALTNALLRAGVEAGAPLIAVVPCCHHFLGRATAFEALSQAGRDAGLALDLPALRLAIADESVATDGEKQRRWRDMGWRQGLDLLIREATGEDRYTPQGQLPRGADDGDFAGFCHRMAEHLQKPLPARWDPARAEAAGYERARQARALALPRSLARRALELWLVLDRALYLVEQGRPVAVGTFCDPSQTPRNILLRSARGGHPPHATH